MKRDMKSMMGMMHDMMGMISMHSGMMPPQADSTLASLKQQIHQQIMEAQAPLWDRFAEVWRSASTVLKGQHKEMMAPPGEGTLPRDWPGGRPSAQLPMASAEERRGGAGAALCLLQRRTG